MFQDSVASGTGCLDDAANLPRQVAYPNALEMILDPS